MRARTRHPARVEVIRVASETTRSGRARHTIRRSYSRIGGRPDRSVAWPRSSPTSRHVTRAGRTERAGRPRDLERSSRSSVHASSMLPSRRRVLRATPRELRRPREDHRGDALRPCLAARTDPLEELDANVDVQVTAPALRYIGRPRPCTHRFDPIEDRLIGVRHDELHARGESRRDVDARGTRRTRDRRAACTATRYANPWEDPSSRPMRSRSPSTSAASATGASRDQGRSRCDGTRGRGAVAGGRRRRSGIASATVGPAATPDPSIPTRG